MITEKDNVFYCDCGFSFERGRSGAHDCGSGLRKRLAESQSKLEKMAAENAELKSYASDCTNAVEFWNSYADAEDKITTVPETPATDAFLAEVRATGVEMFANHIALYNSDSEQHANLFAAQLRQEAK